MDESYFVIQHPLSLESSISKSSDGTTSAPKLKEFIQQHEYFTHLTNTGNLQFLCRDCERSYISHLEEELEAIESQLKDYEIFVHNQQYMTATTSDNVNADEIGRTLDYDLAELQLSIDSMLSHEQRGNDQLNALRLKINSILIDIQNEIKTTNDLDIAHLANRQHLAYLLQLSRSSFDEIKFFSKESIAPLFEFVSDLKHNLFIVNGFRLAYQPSPNSNLPWSEIGIAWSLVCHALMAIRLHYNLPDEVVFKMIHVDSSQPSEVSNFNAAVYTLVSYLDIPDSVITALRGNISGRRSGDCSSNSNISNSSSNSSSNSRSNSSRRIPNSDASSLKQPYQHISRNSSNKLDSYRILRLQPLRKRGLVFLRDIVTRRSGQEDAKSESQAESLLTSSVTNTVGTVAQSFLAMMVQDRSAATTPPLPATAQPSRLPRDGLVDFAADPLAVAESTSTASDARTSPTLLDIERCYGLQGISDDMELAGASSSSADRANTGMAVANYQIAVNCLALYLVATAMELQMLHLIHPESSLWQIVQTLQLARFDQSSSETTANSFNSASGNNNRRSRSSGRSSGKVGSEANPSCDRLFRFVDYSSLIHATDDEQRGVRSHVGDVEGEDDERMSEDDTVIINRGRSNDDMRRLVRDMFVAAESLTLTPPPQVQRRRS